MLFSDFTDRMAEAALVSDLAADEREALRATIEGWAADSNDNAPGRGVDGEHRSAIPALIGAIALAKMALRSMRSIAVTT